MLKYKLTDETKIMDGVVLHRIVALRSFGNVTQGDLGGWIEKESNLSHNGDAWVYGDALVYGHARVFESAKVYGSANVLGDARVYGDALVYGHARVFESAKVYGSANVLGDAKVYGDARVYGDAWVFESAKLDGDGYFYADLSPYGVTYDGHGWLSIGCRGMGVTKWKAEWQSIAKKQGPHATAFAKKYKKIIMALINAQKGGGS